MTGLGPFFFALTAFHALVDLAVADVWDGDFCKSEWLTCGPHDVMNGEVCMTPPVHVAFSTPTNASFVNLAAVVPPSAYTTNASQSPSVFLSDVVWGKPNDNSVFSAGVAILYEFYDQPPPPPSPAHQPPHAPHSLPPPPPPDSTDIHRLGYVRSSRIGRVRPSLLSSTVASITTTDGRQLTGPSQGPSQPVAPSDGGDAPPPPPDIVTNTTGRRTRWLFLRVSDCLLVVSPSPGAAPQCPLPTLPDNVTNLPPHVASVQVFAAVFYQCTKECRFPVYNASACVVDRAPATATPLPPAIAPQPRKPGEVGLPLSVVISASVGGTVLVALLVTLSVMLFRSRHRTLPIPGRRLPADAAPLCRVADATPGPPPPDHEPTF
eukprot:TRINITY_DN21644_c0_g1_i1.p1 TRINITY_DN21644_c0_g1~~TRINITY_DN21644_c0_g1_i1.p1  ORF type:complete len:378 (+),score=43.95 TRINITY_DN21644_c0_g1_i1:102-1235(+)